MSNSNDFGGVPAGYATPQQMQQALAALLQRKKQQPQAAQPIQSWTQVAAGIADTAADQIQLNRLASTMMGGQQAATAALAPPSDDTVPTASPQPSATPQAGGPGYDGDLFNFVKAREGFSATPYADGRQTSIGYGTRAQPGDTTITPDEGEQRLHGELGKAAAFVEASAPNAPQPAKHALTDLTYNAGTKWWNSGLGDAIRSGDMATAKDKFLQYSHADGKFNPGLYSRRVAMSGAFDDAATIANGRQGGQQVAQAAPQDAGAQPVPQMGQKGFYVPLENLPPQMTPAQTQAAQRALASPFLPDHQRQQIMQLLQQSRQPISMDTPQGKVVIDPANRRNQTLYSTAPAAAEKAGMEESQKIVQTGAAHAYQGAQGLANIGSRISPLADDMAKIASDPTWQSGGLPGTRLALERLKSTFGFPSNAAPMEVMRQGRNQMLMTLQEGAKSGTTLTGEQARLFQSEISTMSGAIPGEDATPEGLLRGFKAVGRLGNHWQENGDAVDQWLAGQPNKLPGTGIHKFLRDREKGFHMYDPGEINSPAAQPAPTSTGAPSPGVAPAYTQPPPTPGPQSAAPPVSGLSPAMQTAAIPPVPPGARPYGAPPAVPPGPFTPAPNADAQAARDAAAATMRKHVLSPQTLPGILAPMMPGVGGAAGAVARPAAKMLGEGFKPWMGGLVGIEELVRYLLHGDK